VEELENRKASQDNEKTVVSCQFSVSSSSGGGSGGVAQGVEELEVLARFCFGGVGTPLL
jgi:hypothetical protein